ncbi:uncharacterized protein LOC114361482 [Ostrinia furnacalis]|uniref:uncharacterized protein LOC114361482 n=1 Tax=Ostrinia furnacalis TaxID=93504 RepID=UPI00103E2487|nr:uncharacterized protein LOC114361482 [Ostrinia furnacalis]
MVLKALNMDVDEKCTVAKGPYKTIPVTIRNCTEKEVVHPHASFGQFVQWHAEIFNSSGKTLIQFNYTVLKPMETAKGPYRTTPVIIRNCTEKEVVHPHASFGQFIQWHAKIYNSSGKTFVRFNYTVLKPMETVKGKVRSSFWEDNQWKLRLLIPGFSCLRAITRNIAQALKFKINSKCTITEGSSTVDRFDYDALHQAWEPETEYGRWTWQYELTSIFGHG